jgi:hypothetical protein
VVQQWRKGRPGSEEELAPTVANRQPSTLKGRDPWYGTAGSYEEGEVERLKLLNGGARERGHRRRAGKGWGAASGERVGAESEAIAGWTLGFRSGVVVSSCEKRTAEMVAELALRSNGSGRKRAMGLPWSALA